MKKYYLLILPLFFLFHTSFGQCNNELIEKCKAENGNAKYLKHFKIRFAASKNPKKASVATFTLLLNKGNHYRFNVKNDETKEGKAILDLIENKSFLASNYLPESGKQYSSFDFYCKKTGAYYIDMKFKDGKAGCAVGMISFVEVFNPNK
ncbi:MAG: hypothetical protein GXO79_11410 [Chlorobi bacterium]|nr:hypothetical protein [Chlorobiota bacterium]